MNSMWFILIVFWWTIGVLWTQINIKLIHKHAPTKLWFLIAVSVNVLFSPICMIVAAYCKFKGKETLF